MISNNPEPLFLLFLLLLLSLLLLFIAIPTIIAIITQILRIVVICIILALPAKEWIVQSWKLQPPVGDGATAGLSGQL